MSVMFDYESVNTNCGVRLCGKVLKFQVLKTVQLLLLLSQLILIIATRLSRQTPNLY